MQSSKAYFQFTLGPVQSWISASRTLRDLCTSSYLLSWLTGHAMRGAIGCGAELISPSTEGNPLWRILNQEVAPEAGLGEVQPSLPNTFRAAVAPERLEEAKHAACQAVRKEWERISQRVRDRISKRISGHPGWDWRWEEQIEHFWDIRVVGFVADESTLPLIRRLAPLAEGADDFRYCMEYLGRLAAAEKQIRHYPPHETAGREHAQPDDYRPKCSMLTGFAQMGALDDLGRAFWDAVHHQGSMVQGGWISTRDRLSALGLVKRMAWGADLHRTIGERLRFADTRTIAAAEWLERAREMNLLDISSATDEFDGSEWSGTWLHTAMGRAEDSLEDDLALDPEAGPSEETRKQIEQAIKELGKPTPYLCALLLDGDHMGDRFRTYGLAEYQAASSALARFATEIVPPIVSDSLGELIYAGGDDVLALLPVSSGPRCAARLAAAFAELPLPPTKQHRVPTVSAGLLVFHAAMDLRSALQLAREAESRAKRAGRNRLAVAVARRSGEQSVAALPWEEVPHFEQLLGQFRKQFGEARSASGRWVRAFRELHDTLPADAREVTLTHLLKHAEGVSEKQQKEFLEAWRMWRPSEADPPAGRDTQTDLRFVHLVLSAEFIAREADRLKEPAHA